MYTRTENPLHILQEVIDNSADEAIGGYATEISIECHDDKSFLLVITVEDSCWDASR